MLVVMLLCVGLAFALTSCTDDDGEHIHTPNSAVRENEVSATCSAFGSYDEVIYCSECDTELSREKKEITKLPHTEVVDEAVSPTCTEAGLTEGKHCSVCTEVIIAQETVGENGHTDRNTDYTCDICTADLCTEHEVEIIPAVPATCTEAGLTEGKRCSLCGDILLAQETVGANGHNYAVKNTDGIYFAADADCENAATYFYSCACGEKGTATFTHGVPNGHSFVIEKADIDYQHTPATEYSAAIYYKSCACGKASTTETFTHGDILPGYLTYKLSADSSYYIVTGYVGAQTEISVPHLYDGLPVFVIMEEAFRDNTYIKSISMPNSIQEIGPYAFANCTALESIIIPTSVTNISPYTFSGCTALETIILHSEIDTLGAFAFEKCSALKSITLNEGLKTISDNTFDYCTSLRSISIPDTVTTLGNMAFRHAESLETVKFSRALQSIGNATFQYCIKLGSVELHENINALGSSTFSYCDGLKSIRILGNLTTIGTATFYECRNLEAIYYASNTPGNCGNTNYIFYNAGIDGNGITLTIARDAVIPEGFFTPYIEDNMPKITEIIFEEGATRVNGFATYNKLPYLKDITYPDTITDSSYGAFNNSLWWDNQKTGAVYINGVFYGYKCHCKLAVPKAPVTENFVDSDYSASYDSVIYCEACNYELMRENILICKHSPKPEVEENRVEATCTADGYYDIAVYCAICDEEISRDRKTIPLSHKFNNGVCTLCGSLTSSLGLDFVLNPDGKGYIVTGYGSFKGSVLIIDTYNNLPVTSIADKAFEFCQSLTSVTIGNSVTSIGGNAFHGCQSLISVTIGDSVTSICDYAFFDCSKLTGVIIPDSVTSIGYYAFASCESLTSVIIGGSVTSIGGSAFKECTSLTDVIIPDGVISINTYAFADCKGLISVTIGDGVTSISDYAFEECTSLTSVTIGCSVTSIGGSAFYHCYNLTSVIIPDSVTSIGYYAFADCTGLTSVTIGGSVTSIGSSAFYNCICLTSIAIPDSVTSIGSSAFAACTGLTSVTIGNSVTSIGKSAFYNCIRLASIKYRGSESQWNSISKGSGWNSEAGIYTDYGAYRITYNYIGE